ncbi:MAG TPA: hypothetical protein P5052_01520 [Candidatus Paceibacterota bacterium]|nr:hypothetical protein [Candidatus Paceibacterota bacterium]
MLKTPNNYPHLPVGERIGNFDHFVWPYDPIFIKLDAGETVTLTSEFDCRKTDILDETGRTLPKIHSDTYIGCIVDPEDNIEESNESNNSLIFKFNCDEQQANEDEEL